MITVPSFEDDHKVEDKPVKAISTIMLLWL